MKYLIIGGGAGGASAAARLRRINEEAEIILFEKREYISYTDSNWDQYISEVIPERKKLFIQTPEDFAFRFKIEVRVNSDVEKIDPKNKTITIRDFKTDRAYNETYDKLVLSPCAEPVRPPLEEIDSEGIFILRDINDTHHVRNYIEKHDVKRAVIIGAGFLGLEMVENLHEYGIKTTVIEAAGQVMNSVDYEIATTVHQQLKNKGVNLYFKQTVSAFIARKQNIKIILNGGKILQTNIVILTLGVRPDNHLARQAGLEIGETGGIRVNKYLQTSDPDIYAAGEATEYPHPVSGRPAISFLAGPANKQGRLCADNANFGNLRKYIGSIDTTIAKIFDLTVGATGLPAQMLDRLNIPYQEVIIHAPAHASHDPESIIMQIKINFSPANGKLLGAQIVGTDGVDKRLEIMSAIIKKGGTIHDLVEHEQAYAPPYSSAKDPVNMAGLVADNLLTGKIATINWRELKAIDLTLVTLVDVRSPYEFIVGTIEGAINIPLDNLRTAYKRLPKENPVILFCAIGHQGYIAARILLQQGYHVLNLCGGYRTYIAATATQGTLWETRQPVIETPPRQQPPVDNLLATVNTCGLKAPEPITALKTNMEQLQPGNRIEIQATDPTFTRDVASWANMTGNRLINLKEEKGIVTAVLEKGPPASHIITTAANKTLIVFSDDLDKALAAFIIANGTAATGRKVTMFFTFWGLNIIRRQNPRLIKRKLINETFISLLPSNSTELTLSKFKIFGIGTWMMRKIMQKNQIDTLENLIQQAIANRVEFIACQTSMQIMGLDKDELLPEVSLAGVDTYLERAEQSNVNLFV